VLNFFKLICLFLVIIELEASETINLSSNEQEYLKNHKIIKMCNNPNWEPIEFLNPNNKMSGIALDTLKILEKKLNIKFKHISTTSWSQSQKYLKEKKCDILPAAIKTVKREKYAVFTEPYLKYKLAIITKNDQPWINNIEEIINDNKTIARKKGSGLITKLKKLYPNVKIIETKDYLDALRAVASSKAYCTIATLPVASYYINKFAMNNLYIAGYTNITYKLSIAVRDDQVILKNILDKALKQISSSEHKNIYTKWTNVHINEVGDYTYLQNILIAIVVIILLLIYRQRLLRIKNETLAKLIADKTYELKEINENLEQRIIIEIDKNLKQEKQIFEANKLASMAEMISNIAHQWRQPLSLITTAASGIKVNYEFGVEQSKEDIIKSMDMIILKAKFLSKTLDTLSNLIKENKELEQVKIKDQINEALDMISASLRENDIKLNIEFKKTDDVELVLPLGDLPQVLLNIISNAQEILLKRQIVNAFINIVIYIENNNLIITIEDNAGGVEEQYMDKIFDPYFTTKHQSQGTGLGLHLAYITVVKELNGLLYVKNTLNGAKFFIELPLM